MSYIILPFYLLSFYLLSILSYIILSLLSVVVVHIIILAYNLIIIIYHIILLGNGNLWCGPVDQILFILLLIPKINLSLCVIGVYTSMGGNISFRVLCFGRGVQIRESSLTRISVWEIRGMSIMIPKFFRRHITAAGWGPWLMHLTAEIH